MSALRAVVASDGGNPEGEIMNQLMRERLEATRTRHILATDQRARRLAVAMFPLEVASMAANLRRFCDEGITSPESKETADYIEARIREHFLQTFGVQMVETSHI
jgi:hypothetical protein